MKDARDAFSRLIDSNRRRIVEQWATHIKKDPTYDAIPIEEVEETVFKALDGYHAHVCARNPDKLNDFIATMAAKRLSFDFPLNSMLRAFDGFRVVVTPMLLKDAVRPELLDVIEPLFESVNHAKIRFIEHYQELTATKIRAHVREIETALQQLTEQKELADRAISIKDTFLSNVSHEFRTPLTVIMGFSNLLASGATPPEKTLEIAGLIHKSGETLLKMVDDVILMSKLESGHEKLYSHFVYVADLIKDSAMKADREFPDRKNVWEFNLPGPEVFVVGDQQKLVSLFLGVFSNAVKFSPAGSKIGVRAWIDGDKNVLVAEIADEGLGIPPEITEAIFDKFGARDPQSSLKYQGLGRGLSLARMIANIHGGDVTLKSTEMGKGSVFAVTLSLNPGFAQDQSKGGME
ncbi:MAG: HAMP domain-containing histidine kinase [Nitrospinae bacterium]|nr:HAMP domain-containing histidine kinase [Nitrospinota bacterium]